MGIIILLSAFLLGAILPTGYSLNCYTCNGFTDKACNSPFTPKADYAKACFADACFKLTLKNPRFKEVIVRTCGNVPWQKVVDDPYNLTEVPWEWKTDQQAAVGYVSVHTASCLRDLCNHTPSFYEHAKLLVGFSTLIMLYECLWH